MSGSRQLLEEPNHAGMRGIMRPCRYGTTWLKEACLTWSNFGMGDLPVSVRVRTKHAEKTRVGLWGQSTMLKAVWDVTISQYSVRHFPNEVSRTILKGKRKTITLIDDQTQRQYNCHLIIADGASYENYLGG
ncbi:hypothetical protein MTR_5g009340 [Medicago truncatula]|uniref:Uncharacterized protein n=1 Tax=Medicago truncatula TaxID=3880 RepID=G7KAK8_MEDTR|nr:hypothetical protein MTR_5g009340 [Medicago truncatula]